MKTSSRPVGTFSVDPAALGGGQRVLLVQFSAHRDGSAFSALLLADGFREAGWATTVAFAHEGPMISIFSARGHQVVVAPHKNWLRTTHPFYFVRNVLRELQAASHLQSLIETVQPNLVYVNSGASLAGAWSAWRAKTSCVWHIRELFSNQGGELVTPIGTRQLARRAFHALADQLVAPSRIVAQSVLGGRHRDIAIVPNAASTAFFENTVTRYEARQQFNFPEKELVLGVPGSLRPVKGHPFLLQALPSVLAKIPKLTIAITGEGPAKYQEELKRIVERLELTSQVRFTGVVKDMPAFLRACDVVCVPSVAESFGRTVIEAFAVGTPVVATAVGGIRETIDDGKTGLLVPYGDTKKLAEALLRLLQDVALQINIAERAAEKATQSYHEQSYKRALVAIARKLVEEKEIATQK